MSEANDLAEIASTQIVHEIQDQPMVVVPQGYEVRDLENFLDAPRRVRASPRLNSADSFIDYVLNNKDDATAIFADEDSAVVRAVMDYHQAGEDSCYLPGWCAHQAHYACKISREWTSWLRLNGELQLQENFAEMLETRAQEIISPAGAELLETALKFQVIRKATFGSAMRLNTGEFQFQFNEENQKGTVELPEEITIAVAPFHNGDKYEVKARLRYRLREGILKLAYHLVDPEKVTEHAFEKIVTEIGEKLPDVPLYQGRL